MTGSTETTFYVLAVYFGSVGIVRYRHAIWAGMTADLFGVLGSLFAVNLLIGQPSENEAVSVQPHIQCDGLKPVWLIHHGQLSRLNLYGSPGDGTDVQTRLFPGRRYQGLCSKTPIRLRQLILWVE